MPEDLPKYTTLSAAQVAWLQQSLFWADSDWIEWKMALKSGGKPSLIESEVLKLEEDPDP